MANIRDPDVRRALETLEDEVENFEAKIIGLERELDDASDDIKKLKSTIDDLENDNAELQSRVEELEAALAEAYLMSEANDGAEGRSNSILSGQGSDVSNTADNKAVNK